MTSPSSSGQPSSPSLSACPTASSVSAPFLLWHVSQAFRFFADALEPPALHPLLCASRRLYIHHRARVSAFSFRPEEAPEALSALPGDSEADSEGSRTRDSSCPLGGAKAADSSSSLAFSRSSLGSSSFVLTCTPLPSSSPASRAPRRCGAATCSPAASDPLAGASPSLAVLSGRRSAPLTLESSFSAAQEGRATWAVSMRLPADAPRAHRHRVSLFIPLAFSLDARSSSSASAPRLSYFSAHAPEEDCGCTSAGGLGVQPGDSRRMTGSRRGGGNEHIKTARPSPAPSASCCCVLARAYGGAPCHHVFASFLLLARQLLLACRQEARGEASAQECGDLENQGESDLVWLGDSPAKDEQEPDARDMNAGKARNAKSTTEARAARGGDAGSARRGKKTTPEARRAGAERGTNETAEDADESPDSPRLVTGPRGSPSRPEGPERGPRRRRRSCETEEPRERKRQPSPSRLESEEESARRPRVKAGEKPARRARRAGLCAASDEDEEISRGLYSESLAATAGGGDADLRSAAAAGEVAECASSPLSISSSVADCLAAVSAEAAAPSQDDDVTDSRDARDANADDAASHQEDAVKGGEAGDRRAEGSRSRQRGTGDAEAPPELSLEESIRRAAPADARRLSADAPAHCDLRDREIDAEDVLGTRDDPSAAARTPRISCESASASAPSSLSVSSFSAGASLSASSPSLKSSPSCVPCDLAPARPSPLCRTSDAPATDAGARIAGDLPQRRAGPAPRFAGRPAEETWATVSSVYSPNSLLQKQVRSLASPCARPAGQQREEKPKRLAKDLKAARATETEAVEEEVDEVVDSSEEDGEEGAIVKREKQAGSASSRAPFSSPLQPRSSLRSLSDEAATKSRCGDPADARAGSASPRFQVSSPRLSRFSTPLSSPRSSSAAAASRASRLSFSSPSSRSSGSASAPSASLSSPLACLPRSPVKPDGREVHSPFFSPQSGRRPATGRAAASPQTPPHFVSPVVAPAPLRRNSLPSEGPGGGGIAALTPERRSSLREAAARRAGLSYGSPQRGAEMAARLASHSASVPPLRGCRAARATSVPAESAVSGATPRRRHCGSPGGGRHAAARRPLGRDRARERPRRLAPVARQAEPCGQRRSCAVDAAAETRAVEAGVCEIQSLRTATGARRGEKRCPLKRLVPVGRRGFAGNSAFEPYTLSFVSELSSRMR